MASTRTVSTARRSRSVQPSSYGRSACVAGASGAGVRAARPARRCRRPPADVAASWRLLRGVVHAGGLLGGPGPLPTRGTGSCTGRQAVTVITGSVVAEARRGAARSPRRVRRAAQVARAVRRPAFGELPETPGRHDGAYVLRDARRWRVADAQCRPPTDVRAERSAPAAAGRRARGRRLRRADQAADHRAAAGHHGAGDVPGRARAARRSAWCWPPWSAARWPRAAPTR